MRSHGAAKATHKVAGRTTTQGLVALQITSTTQSSSSSSSNTNDSNVNDVHSTTNTAAMVKVASETDFAALSQTFVDLVHTIVQTVVSLEPSSPSSSSSSTTVSQTTTDTDVDAPLAEQILQQPAVVSEDTTSSKKLTIQDCLNDAIVSIRENISITEAIHFPNIDTVATTSNGDEENRSHGIYAGYVHNKVDTVSNHNNNVSAGTAAAIVLLAPTTTITNPSSSNTTTTTPTPTSHLTVEEIQSIGKQLAMHIVAAKPQYMSIADIPSDVLDKERDIIQQQLEHDPNQAQKPPAILEKIIQGKLQKYYESVVLLEQSHYIVEKNPKIASHLQQHHLSLVRYDYMAI